MNLEALLTEYNLHIDASYEEFIKKFCNTHGAAGNETTKTMFLLNNWYEGYLYCMLIGININVRKKYIGTKTEKVRHWSKNYKDQLAYSLSIVFSKKDVRKELKIETREQIQSNFSEIETFMKQLKEICDEYCNGGLYYLKKEFES